MEFDGINEMERFFNYVISQIIFRLYNLKKKRKMKK